MTQTGVTVPDDLEALRDRELFEVIGHIQRVRYELAESEQRCQEELDRRRADPDEVLAE